MRISRSTAILLSAAVAATVIAYSPSLTSGLAWDDYLALRPRGWSEIGAAFTQTWDPTRHWPIFYRPLSIAYYALLFNLFALNAWALHAVSLVELTLTAWLLALFVRRETGSASLGLTAAVLYPVLPSVTHAAGLFVYQQNHLESGLCILGGLFCWQRCRASDRLSSWWAVGVFSVAAFLVKEDAIMLFPALLVVQAIRARVTRDVPAPNGRLCLVAGMFTVGLFAARLAILGELGGNDVGFAFGLMARNVVRGPLRVLAVYQGVFLEDAPIYRAASLVVLTSWIAGSVAVWLQPAARTSRSAALWLTGLVFLVLFSLPLATMSDQQRYYAQSMAAVLMLVGGADALGRRLIRHVGRVTLAGAVLAITVVLCGATREIVHSFQPCTGDALRSDLDPVGWPEVPAEIRAWLLKKPDGCRRGLFTPVTSLDVITWGIASASPDASPSAAGGHVGRAATALLRHDAAEMTFRSRASGAPSVQTSLSIVSDGHAALIVPQTSEWRTTTLALQPNTRTEWRLMHRVDFRLVAPRESAPDNGFDLGPIAVTRGR